MLVALLGFCQPGYSLEPGKQALSLEEAIRLALQNNAEVLVAKKDIANTLGAVLEVRSELLPQISARAALNQQSDGLTEQPEGFPSGFSSARSWSTTVEVSQLLFQGRRALNALNIANLRRTSSFFAFLETTIDVIDRVTTEYYSVVLAARIIRVQEESLTLLEQQLRDQQNRFEAGTVPQFNVLRSQVELANARPELIRAKNDFRVAQLRLARVMGMSNYEIGGGGLAFRLTDSLEAKQQPIDLAEFLTAAKQSRPLLKSRRLAVLEASETIKVELGTRIPRIEAVVGYEWRNSGFSDDLGDVINGWFAGLRGTWNIFDGFRIEGRVQQARAALEQAKVLYEDAERQVELEVFEAYSQWQQASELIESQGVNVEQAEEALRLATARLDAGTATQLELFDARVALNRAQVTRLQAMFDYTRAVSSIDRASGRTLIYEDAFEDPLLQKRWVRRLREQEGMRAQNLQQ